MSSYYDDASLMLLASGGAQKDGKVYSVKPTDGSGDFTFTRGSNLSATRVNASQLIEKGRENLLLQSNQFDTTWTNTNTTETSGQSGYDGTNNAWLLSKSALGGYIYQNITSSGLVSFSLYLKSGTLDWVNITINGASSFSAVYADLANGVTATTQGGDYVDSSIESVGGGWHRLTLIGKGGTSRVRIYPADGDNDVSGTSGNILIQDAQLEQGLVATSVIETGASTAQAGILENTPRFDYSGGATCPSLLLEPSRSNLVTLSEYPEGYAAAFRGSFNTNAAISPQGVQNASLFTEDTTSNNTHFYAVTSLSWVAGTTYTISVYVKSNGRSIVLTQGNQNVINFTTYFNLTTGEVGNSNASNASIENVGNGWYRCSVTQTALTTSGTNILINAWDEEEWNYTYTGNGVSGFYSYGHQLEAGSYLTSYIPTYGVSQTRAVDNMTTTFSSPFATNGSATIFFHELGLADSDDIASAGGDYRYEGSSGNYVSLTTDITDWRIRIQSGGSSNFQGLSGYAKTDPIKVAIVVTSTTYSIYANGSAVIENQSLTATADFSSIDGFRTIMQDRNGVRKALQHLVFPTALSDLDLAILTGATTYNTFAAMALALNYTVYE